MNEGTATVYIRTQREDTQMSTKKTFCGWCVVELMGHAKIAGMVTEDSIAGEGVLRVDVPEIDGHPAFTKFISPKAVYSMAPTTEEIARAVAAHERHPPVAPWMLPRASIPAAIGADDDHDYDAADDHEEFCE